MQKNATEAENFRPLPKRHLYRVFVSALFFLSGACFSSWASRIPTIQQEMDLSEAGLGAVLLALTVGLMVSLPVSGWLVVRLGSRRGVVCAALLYSMLLVGIGLAEVRLLLIAAMFCFGFSCNLINHI